MRSRLFLVSVAAVLAFGPMLSASTHSRPNEVKIVTDNALKAEPATAALVGEWLGLAETRNDRVKPESLKMDLFIKVDGSVTGTIGEWKLQDSVIRRTNPKERQDFMAEFLISGLASGMKTSDSGQSRIAIPIDFKGAGATGTIRGYAEHKKDGKIIRHRWNITRLNRCPIK